MNYTLENTFQLVVVVVVVDIHWEKPALNLLFQFTLSESMLPFWYFLICWNITLANENYLTDEGKIADLPSVVVVLRKLRLANIKNVQGQKQNARNLFQVILSEISG